MTDSIEDLDEFEGESNDSKLVKDLRKQLAAAKKETAEAAKIAQEFQTERRKASVAEALTARGASPKLAKFYDGEDASPEAVDAWVAENAELFGIETEQSPEDAEASAAAEQIQRVTSGAGKGLVRGTPEWYQYMLTPGNATDKELQEAGILPKL